MLIKEFQKIYKPPKQDNTFCYYPYYALVFKLYDNGNLSKVAPCCMMHDTNHNSILEAEQLKNLNPDQIFHHQEFVKFRENLDNNVKDPRCATCWNLEEKGQISHRMYTGWDFDEPFESSLKEVDLSLSNKCNLACRMCNIGSSHQLYEDISNLQKNKLYSKYNIASNSAMLSHNLPKDTSNNIILKWIYDNTSKIKILKISGGEPLYDKNVIKLLNKFIKDKVAKDTALVFHTNATLIDDKKIEMMNEFKYQMHTFSIDGTDKIYDYIRHKSDFSKVEKNILNWVSNSRNIKSLNLNFVLSAINVSNIVDYLEWVILLFHNKIKVNIFFSEVRPFDRGIDISNLPVSYLQDIKDKFEKFAVNFEKIRQKNMNLPNFFSYEYTNIINLLKTSIEHNNYHKNKNKLYDEISILDKVRNQNYADYLDDKLVTILNHIHINHI